MATMQQLAEEAALIAASLPDPAAGSHALGFALRAAKPANGRIEKEARSDALLAALRQIRQTLRTEGDQT